MTQNGQNRKKSTSMGKTEARRQRQAAALRANLHRRKAGDKAAAGNKAPLRDKGGQT